MFASFSSAANSLSHLYTLSMNRQKLSFQAGERHSLVTTFSFILQPLFIPSIPWTFQKQKSYLF